MKITNHVFVERKNSFQFESRGRCTCFVDVMHVQMAILLRCFGCVPSTQEKFQVSNSNQGVGIVKPRLGLCDWNSGGGGGVQYLLPGGPTQMVKHPVYQRLSKSVSKPLNSKRIFFHAGTGRNALCN